LIVEIQDIDAQGDGVILVAGREIAVPAALPGDRVEIGADGRFLRVVDRTPRGTIGCPHRDCPGCPLQGLAYKRQLEAKARRVARVLERHLPPESVPDILPTRESPLQIGYRAGAKLVLARGRKGVRVGIYGRGSHSVVDIPYCPVHHPLIARGVRALRRHLGKAPGLVGPRGWLRYAGLQVTGEPERLSLSLVTRSSEGSGLLLSLAARLREDLPELAGLIQNVNATEGNEVFGKEWRGVWGEETAWERLGEVGVRASPGAFLQANRAQASRVYAEAAQWLQVKPDDRVVDLFCGVGGLALNLAPRVESVVGIEVNPAAVTDAQATAQRCGADCAEFRCASAEEGWAGLRAEGFKPDLVTVNPPRKGMGAVLAENLRNSMARAVLYVSCNPETLSRDAATLCEGNTYRLRRIQPVDFFPQTAHVETVALFTRLD